MFSPDISSQSATAPPTRNPRRRPRSTDASSLQQPKAKRQRSALNSDTFIPPTKQNGRVQKTHLAGGQPTTIPLDESSMAFESRSMVVRGNKKKGSDRSPKGDGSTTLMKNEQYMVTQLPSLPDRLRHDLKGHFSGAFSSFDGHAVVLTHTHALVWYYCHPSGSPETFSFALPGASYKETDPLPLGSLVSPSTSSTEPGLLIVMPSTGKVTYWEAISNAATLDLIRQQRHGVEGSVGSLQFGETVEQIVNVEPAGFILVFTSGRLAHLTVKDTHGRPNVSVQTMSRTPGGAGILTGLRNVFRGSNRKGLIAVRPGASLVRGHREVVVATESGLFEIWDVNWNGQYSMRFEVDAETRLKEVSTTFQTSSGNERLNVRVVDIVPLEYIHNTLKTGDNDEEEARILVCICTDGPTTTRYALVELLLSQSTTRAERYYPIQCYTSSVQRSFDWKPRLLLPQPGHTAFIVFQTAIVLIRIAGYGKTTDLDVIDRHLLSKPYQDVIDFQTEGNYEVVGCGIEDCEDESTMTAEAVKLHRPKSKYPSCTLLVRGFGLVRITAENPVSDHSGGQPVVTAKAKIEQAVFFGNIPSNPLDFSGRSEISFPQEEVEKAALQISREILDSTSPFIPAVAPSLENQLKMRANSLHSLIQHVRKTYAPVSRVTKWKLMWGAEKMAAAREIWKAYDLRLRHNPGDHDTLFAHFVELLHERFKTEPNPDVGEFDAVRQWFTRDVWRLEVVVPWAWGTVNELYRNDGMTDDRVVAKLICDAYDLCLRALGTAYRFREDFAALYGLEGEDWDEGILRSGYEGVPELWTATPVGLPFVQQLTNAGRTFVNKFWGGVSDEEPAKGETPDPADLEKLRKENIRLVEITCKQQTERIRWCAAQPSENHQNEAVRLKNNLRTVRNYQLVDLGRLDMLEDCIRLAEKYEDMPTLVELVVMQSVKIAEDLTTAKTDEIESARAQDELEERIRGYFKRHGDVWATSFFSSYVENGQLGSLMSEFKEYQPYLTKFLREGRGLQKLNWINEVLAEKNFPGAVEALTEHALRRETDVWSKKVELSIIKLAELCVSTTAAADRIPDTEWIDEDLAYLRIQEELFKAITPALFGALDKKAEIQLAMEQFGGRVNKRTPALQQLLEQSLIHLLKRLNMLPTQLVEAMTLLDFRFNSGDVVDDKSHVDRIKDLNENQFYYALLALSLKGMEKERRELLEKIVWRRCMIHDDWEDLNKTQFKDDVETETATRATALFRTLKRGYKNGFEDIWNSVSPSVVLGAGCSADDLRPLFGRNTDLLEPLSKDYRVEDAVLQRYIKHGRLEEWFNGVKAAASQSVKDDRRRDDELATRESEMAAKELDDMEHWDDVLITSS